MEGLIIISEGSLFMIGAKNGMPVYQPITLDELKNFLEDSQTLAEAQEDGAMHIPV